MRQWWKKPLGASNGEITAIRYGQLVALQVWRCWPEESIHELADAFLEWDADGRLKLVEKKPGGDLDIVMRYYDGSGSGAAVTREDHLVSGYRTARAKRHYMILARDPEQRRRGNE